MLSFQSVAIILPVLLYLFFSYISMLIVISEIYGTN